MMSMLLLCIVTEYGELDFHYTLFSLRLNHMMQAAVTLLY